MQANKTRLYKNYATDIYCNCATFDEAGYKEMAGTILRTYRAFLPSDKKAKIVDIGCGSGFFLYALRSAGFLDVRGVDASPEQVELAISMKLDARCADALEFLRDAENRYDLIVCTDMIEHLTKEQVIDYFALVHRALKSGGKFLCTAPNADSPFAPRFMYRDLTHEQIFTESSLKQLFTVVGFSPEFIGEQNIPATSIQAHARKALSCVYRAFWRLFMIAELGKEAFGVPLSFNIVGVGRKK